MKHIAAFLSFFCLCSAYTVTAETNACFNKKQCLPGQSQESVSISAQVCFVDQSFDHYLTLGFVAPDATNAPPKAAQSEVTTWTSRSILAKTYIIRTGLSPPHLLFA